ncbi:MAG: hypothetical protein ACUVRV_07880 [Cyanobacteriota bacterium]
MSDTNQETKQEIKDLLVILTQQVTALSERMARIEEGFYTLDKKIDIRYSELDKKMDTQFAALDKKIDVHYSELDKKMDTQFAALDKKADALDKRMEVGFTEVRGEFKGIDGDLRRVEETLATRIDGINKRVDNQEFFNRGVLVAAIGGTLGAVAKVLFFPNSGL